MELDGICHINIQNKAVLEIGPGTGNLTSAILKRNPSKLLVVEKDNKLAEHIRADTAGSAEMISKVKNKEKAAIASSLSAKTYKLEIIQNNIENEKGNLTRFLVMGKDIIQPEFGSKKYITSFLFKLKSKPAALYQSLGGFAINGVNLTKLQSYPEKNSFDSFFFLCDLDGHIEDPRVQKSLEDLGLHCQDFHVLGVFEADKQREK